MFVPRPNVWDRTNRWLTLAANLGVLLGLIVLVFEVRQNATLSRVALETSRAEAQATTELRLIAPELTEVWVKAIDTPEALSPAEIRTMDGTLVAIVMTWERLSAMQEGGLVDRARIEQHIQNNAPFYFGFPFAKKWWRENAIGWEGADVYAIANPIIEATDDSFVARYYERLAFDPIVDVDPRGDDIVEERTP